MNKQLTKIAKALVSPAKGLLAADESAGTIEKRFAALGIPSNPEMHRKYRQMLFTTAGVEEFLSGIIMFDETVRQKTGDGTLFPEYLTKKGIIPGIKVDEGREPFGEGEEATKGLDGLGKRLQEYSQTELQFTKWRGVIKITDIYPTEALLEETAKRMTEYAKVSQEAGFVPICEPEVLMDGNHTTARCEEVTTKILKVLFEKLKQGSVNLGALILKVNMALPGKDSGVKAAPLEVAQATLRTLKNSVPSEVPGIVFLSGGQTSQEATANLNEINKLMGDVPWQLSFSFARALQNEPLEAWAGQDSNLKKAQEMFYKRAKLISLARQGKYQKEMENEL